MFGLWPLDQLGVYHSSLQKDQLRKGMNKVAFTHSFKVGFYMILLVFRLLKGGTYPGYFLAILHWWKWWRRLRPTEALITANPLPLRLKPLPPRNEGLARDFRLLGTSWDHLERAFLLIFSGDGIAFWPGKKWSQLSTTPRGSVCRFAPEMNVAVGG